MKEREFCQSCGMELASKEVCGTNKDNSINEEHCIYCFKDGADDIIDISVKHMSESGMLKEL